MKQLLTLSQTCKELQGALAKTQLRKASLWDAVSRELTSWYVIRELEVQLP